MACASLRVPRIVTARIDPRAEHAAASIQTEASAEVWQN
jgi:hypothetical protein